MKKIFYVALSTLLVLFGLTFSLHNRQTISIQYYALHTQVELVLLLFFTFAFGLAVGYAATWISTFHTRRRASQRQREIRAQQARASRALI